MKKLLCSLLLLAAASVATVQADIQAPPGSEQGPTRKFSRGLANALGGFISEVPYQIASTNDIDGNGALPYGTFRGVSRGLYRTAAGIYEMITAPFPTNKGKYTPFLREQNVWVRSGYEEFPPELGWESRYNYSR